jgi:hypothetical protein
MGLSLVREAGRVQSPPEPTILSLMRPGQRHVLDVHLEGAKVGKAWPWIVLSAVVVAGGATAGVWAASNGPLVGPEGSLGSLDARQK